MSSSINHRSRNYTSKINPGLHAQALAFGVEAFLFKIPGEPTVFLGYVKDRNRGDAKYPQDGIREFDLDSCVKRMDSYLATTIRDRNAQKDTDKRARDFMDTH